MHYLTCPERLIMKSTQCSHCGGPLKYNQEREVYICEQCDYEYLPSNIVVNNITNNIYSDRYVPIPQKPVSNVVSQIIKVCLYLSYLALIIFAFAKFNYIMSFGRGTPECKMINAEQITFILILLSGIIICLSTMAYEVNPIVYIITGGIFGFYLVFYASVLRSGDYCSKNAFIFWAVAVVSTIIGKILDKLIYRRR